MHETTQKLVNIAKELGGAITETKHDNAGWGSSCSYGTAWIIERGNTIYSTGSHIDPQPFTILTITFAAPIDFGDLSDRMGIVRAWTRYGTAPIDRLTVYDHPRLTPQFGDFEDGIVIATCSYKNCGYRKPHYTLYPAGPTECMFG
jgi:hypothetical protein